MRAGLVVFLFALVAVPAHSQNLSEIFRWSTDRELYRLAPGGTVEIAVRLDIAARHLVYRESVKLALEAPEGFTLGEPTFPASVRKYDEFSNEEKELYPAGRHIFRATVTAASGLAGRYEAQLVLAYRGCSDKLCFFPQRPKLTVWFEVTDRPQDEESRPPVAQPTAPPSLPEEPDEPGLVGTDVEDIQLDLPAILPQAGTSVTEATAAGTTAVTPAGSGLSQGTGEFSALAQQGRYGLLLVLLFVAGLGTSLLPCVYPIIPITVGVIGASGAKSRGEAFALSGTFVLGMALMFSVLGLFAGLAGQLSGGILAHPGVKVGLALIFAAMALSMLGLFEMQLPAGIATRLSNVGGRGFAGAFGMGLVSGLLATPCTGPVLAGVLAYIAQTRDPLLGFVSLLVFSLGLGVLFLAVGTFSGVLSTLPRSGRWMEVVKSLFGVAFLALALYYVRTLIPPLNAVLRPSAGVILAGLGLAVAGAALGALHLAFQRGAAMVNLRKSVGVGLMALGLFAAGAAPLSEPPVPAGWLHDHDEAVALGRAQGKPVMIDFFTQDCSNCKKLARVTFAHARVAAELEQFVVAKVDLTDEGSATVQRLIGQYGIVGVPLVVFYDASGRELPALRLADFEGPERFLERLRQVRRVH